MTRCLLSLIMVIALSLFALLPRAALSQGGDVDLMPCLTGQMTAQPDMASSDHCASSHDGMSDACMIACLAGAAILPETLAPCPAQLGGKAHIIPAPCPLIGRGSDADERPPRSS
ncbi:hypothetical protein [Paracoccus sp. (in: a-proteobacteria)]|uniref:hypothetical protein n=1 Tax=Paracoccus sp. TaxID=267 RepID=UPI002896BAD2|nr:hypothetical protein [Paracoccus sp. (in: a-proteobacteria)]